MHSGGGGAAPCVCVSSRKLLRSFPYFKDISLKGLGKSLNNRAPSENMYLLLELQYAISFLHKYKRAERSETTLSYFSFLQHFSFSVLPPTLFEKKRKLLSVTAVDIGGELELYALCFRG